MAERYPVPVPPMEPIELPPQGTWGTPPLHEKPGFDWNEFLRGLGQNAGRFVQNLTQLAVDRIGAKPLTGRPPVGAAATADGLATAKKIAVYALGALAVAAAVGFGIRLARKA